MIKCDKGAVIKFVIVVKFNISTRNCETETSNEHKHCTTQPLDTTCGGTRGDSPTPLESALGNYASDYVRVKTGSFLAVEDQLKASSTLGDYTVCHGPCCLI